MEPTKAMFRLEVHTVTHSLLSNCHRDFLSCRGQEADFEKFEPYDINSSWGYIETNRYFLDALERGIRPEPNEDDGLIADVLVDAARRSMREKKTISVASKGME